MVDSAQARRILLLRHGVTGWNADGRYQGQTDIELAETGHQQAKAAAHALGTTYAVTRIVSSDLMRTQQTAAYVAEETGREVALDPRLREVCAGEAEGLNRAQILDRFGEMPASWEPYGGESWPTVAARFSAAVNDVAQSVAPGETVVVVAHGGAIRQGVAAFLGWDASVVATLAPLPNCSWIELLASDTAHGLIPSAPWRLATYATGAPIS
ncbi:putative phosphoglycerate mutase [Nocardioides albertanoniae]|uniref:Putative phosphoglycerate mutase n=1 Tax=Nocardioides albertanoniae TaxID=1175486 RepID=A0A543A4M1_9ACTN|nr:histidine phosphatase family protein [Nocardioides albertanoniae]TQL67549.1 putative phosphoglycerate mutase [Nocardioides albertanoniae]